MPATPLAAVKKRPDAECVAALEYLLEKAKAGHITGIIAACVDGSGNTFQQWGGLIHTARMVGSIEMLKFAVIRECGLYEAGL